jgi:hypothetical protein
VADSDAFVEAILGEIDGAFEGGIKRLLNAPTQNDRGHERLVRPEWRKCDTGREKKRSG